MAADWTGPQPVDLTERPWMSGHHTVHTATMRCHYMYANGFCTKGKDCKYSHDINNQAFPIASAPQNINGRSFAGRSLQRAQQVARWEQERNNAGLQAQAPAPVRQAPRPAGLRPWQSSNWRRPVSAEAPAFVPQAPAQDSSREASASPERVITPPLAPARTLTQETTPAVSPRATWKQLPVPRPQNPLANIWALNPDLICDRQIMRGSTILCGQIIRFQGNRSTVEYIPKWAFDEMILYRRR